MIMEEQDTQKPTLSYTELTDIIDLTLWSGQLLLQHGADSQRVEETVHRLGTALGCNWMDVFVSYSDIGVSAISGEGFRTKIRRVVRIGVNMTIVSAISRLSRRVESGELDRFQVRSELHRISTTPHHYNRWLVALMVGLACAAFSRLFGGDWTVFAITWLSAGTAMVARQELARRHFNALLVVVATAFVGGILASSATRIPGIAEPETALVSSVLLLVPGVPLINAVNDIVEGYVVVGIARGLIGAIISLAIALGLLMAMALTGISSL
ncbi:MAG: Inner membrane protein YjjP [Anaerolineae bacterium]|nr:Inner membrane protein YjjP [Anaerolineae bacterium]